MKKATVRLRDYDDSYHTEFFYDHSIVKINHMKVKKAFKNYQKPTLVAHKMRCGNRIL